MKKTISTSLLMLNSLFLFANAGLGRGNNEALFLIGLIVLSFIFGIIFVFVYFYNGKKTNERLTLLSFTTITLLVSLLKHLPNIEYIQSWFQIWWLVIALLLFHFVIIIYHFATKQHLKT